MEATDINTIDQAQHFCENSDNESGLSNKMIEFITFVTGHDADTVRQLYKDWKLNLK